VRLARQLGATAIFNGELGDHVFGYAPGHEAVTEHVWRRDFGRGLFRAALDYAYLKRISLGRVVFRALRDGFRAAPSRHWSMNTYMRNTIKRDARARDYTSNEALEQYESQAERFLHPWLRDIDSVPPGRFWLIYAVINRTSTAYDQPFAAVGDPPIVSPLASQPLVESSLRIASSLHVHGGTDRAVARAAFTPELSQLVLGRTGKGTPVGWISEVIDRNRDFLRETLLDGALVKEGILERKKLETVLGDQISTSRLAAPELIIHLYIEAWLRHWTPQNQSVAR
jgi:asparagine synthase (glutamine-hydrolysing)